MKELFRICIFIIFIIFSCKEDDTIENQEIINCSIGEVSSELIYTNCNELEQDTVSVCDMVVIQDIIFLKEEEKQWLPYYCLDKGEKTYFVNNNGDETFLEIKAQIHAVTSTHYKDENGCEYSSEKDKVYCIHSEFVYVELSSNILDGFISIRAHNTLKTPFVESKTEAVLSFSSNYAGRNYPILNSGLDTEIIDPPIYFDHIEILGVTYNDIYSFNILFENNELELYYSKELGIVSFKDIEDIQWRLQ